MKIEIEVDGALLADLEAILRSPYWPSMGEPEAGRPSDWQWPIYTIYGALTFPNLMPKSDAVDDVKTLGDVALQIIRHHIGLYRNARIALIKDAILRLGGDDDAVNEAIEGYDAMADTRDFSEIKSDVEKAVLG